MDQVVNTIIAPYLAQGNNPCDLTAKVEVYPIKFESATYGLVSSSEQLTNVSLSNSALGVALPVGAVQGMKIVNLPSSGKLDLVANNPCGVQVRVANLDLNPDQEQPISVSKATFNAVAEWQKTANSTGIDLHTFLESRSDISYAEKLYVVQQTTFRGKPYPETLRSNITQRRINPIVIPWPPVRPPGWPVDPPNPPGGGRNDCDCTTLQLNVSANTTPIRGSNSNNMGGRNMSGIYGSDEDMKASDEVKLWSAYAIKGPSRYMELWADTERNRCVAPPFVFGWNDVSTGQAVTDEDIFPSFTSELSYNMLCVNGDNLPDGECGCDREIKYEVAYNSVVRAQAEYNGNGNVFCNNTHSALAAALDYVILTAGDNEIEDGEFDLLAFNLNSQIAECNMEYIGPYADDFIRLGFYAFAYIKGIDPSTGIPLANELLSMEYDQYAASGGLDAISEIFGGPWRQFNGSCGGGVVGQSAGITPTSSKVNGTAILKANTPYRIVLAAGSRLRVGGQRRWHANARVHSSFSMTGILRGQTNANTDFEEHCCSPPAATYSIATFSEGVVETSGVTAFSWMLSIEGFLNLWNISHDVDGQLGEIIGENPRGCGTDVSIISPRSDQQQLENSLLSINQSFAIEIPRNIDVRETLRLINVSGQVMYNARLQELDAIDLRLPGLPSGIYFVSLLRADGTSFITKIAHSR
jgi:hypothetical protein